MCYGDEHRVAVTLRYGLGINGVVIVFLQINPARDPNFFTPTCPNPFVSSKYVRASSETPLDDPSRDYFWSTSVSAGEEFFS